MQRRVKMRVHPQMPGDLVCLVHPTRTGAADIEFLKRDDIGAGRCDHVGDAGGIRLATAAAAAVDVVGQQPDLKKLGWRGWLYVHGAGTRLRSFSFRDIALLELLYMLQALFRLLFVLAIAGAAYLVYRTWSQYAFDDVMVALRSIPASHFALALLFAACSYTCLACGDWLAVRYAGKPLPFRQTALASFTALSIGHNVGLAAMSSGAVRYRFYTRWGLVGEDVAKIIVFCGTTVALGLATLGAASLYFRPDDAAEMTGLDHASISGIALACLVIPLVYLALSAWVRAPLRIRSWTFELPRLPLAVGQIIVGTVNFAFVAACLHQMLSAVGDAPYLKVAAASITANIAAIVSHVPGGLGVLEATIVQVLPGAASIAAVIAYRVVYYFVPLAVGVPLLVGSEFALKSASSHR